MPGLAAVIAYAAPKLGIVIPLGLVCIVIVVALPLTARSGKLTIPVAGCMAVAGVVVALLVGSLSGANRVRGTVLGVVLAIVFFVLVAAVAGSVLGIFFYREPSGGPD